jgi:ABC-type Zn uptake system ZnuABC Zn-binding protein ZnuA
MKEVANEIKVIIENIINKENQGERYISMMEDSISNVHKGIQ